jgi:hypothetical protein
VGDEVGDIDELKDFIVPDALLKARIQWRRGDEM